MQAPTDIGGTPTCFVGTLGEVTPVAGGTAQGCIPAPFAGADDATCEAGFCQNPCAADTDCFGGTTCRVSDGLCVLCEADADCTGDLTNCIEEFGACGCANDGECAGNAAGENCIEATGACGCVDDADCAGSPGGDICFDGACGCNSADDCTADPAFDGTSFVCEAFN